MNKIIHIFRRGDRICNIAKQYKTTPYKILSDNNITNFDYIADYTPLVINIDSKCTEFLVVSFVQIIKERYI